MKKVISLILALLMLAGMFTIQASAATDPVIVDEVLNSITEEEETGLGVAFLYEMNMQGVAIKAGTNRTFDKANVTLGGVSYPVVKMGAIVTNSSITGTNIDSMTIEAAASAAGEDAKIKDVEAKKLWGWDEDSCSFAVRVTNIPAISKKTQIYARPYYIYKDASGNQQVVYGGVANKSYYSGWCDAQGKVVLPAIGTDIDVTKKKNRIRVSAATIVDRTVTLTFKNYTTNWITEETDYVKWTAYDAAGKALKTDTIYIGCIDTKKNKEKSFTFDVPDATAQVKLTSSKIVYWTEWA